MENFWLSRSTWLRENMPFDNKLAFFFLRDLFPPHWKCTEWHVNKTWIGSHKKSNVIFFFLASRQTFLRVEKVTLGWIRIHDNRISHHRSGMWASIRTAPLAVTSQLSSRAPSDGYGDSIKCTTLHYSPNTLSRLEDETLAPNASRKTFSDI